MPHADDFLGAILEDPDNDALRLAFADWLEERGDPRGEFIRIQFELAEMKGNDQRFPALFRRELDLISEHKEQWFGPERQRFGNWECHRGFWDEVGCDARTFLDNADLIFARHPIRNATIYNYRQENLAEFLACPHLRRLSTLKLRYWMDAADAALLARCSHLENIGHLEVRLADGAKRVGRAALKARFGHRVEC